MHINPADIVNSIYRVVQACTGIDICLTEIAVDHHRLADADTRHEHLDFFVLAVLRFIEHNERVIEGFSPHVS